MAAVAILDLRNFEFFTVRRVTSVAEMGIGKLQGTRLLFCSVPVGRLWKQWLVCYSIVQR